MKHTSVFRSDLFQNKVVLITGGASGIGLEMAHTFGAHGARLALMGRTPERLESAAAALTREGTEVVTVAGDVRGYEACVTAVAKVLERFGAIDVLVNNAAGNFLCPPEELSSNAFKSVIEIDLVGSFHMAKACFASLTQTKGAILNISATLHHGGTPLQAHASAAKAGVDALTSNLACEWGPLGIRVNGIAPGPIADTEGVTRLLPGPMLEKLAQTIPVQRLGLKSDIADAALFLCSPASSFTTGVTLVVDGGESLVRVFSPLKGIYAQMQKGKPPSKNA